MPTEVFEDVVDLEIGLIEAEHPDPSNPERHVRSYPLPALSPTSSRETRQFRCVVLENPYLRVTLLPDLGGRIHTILDKRTNTQILGPAESWAAKKSGSRGAEIREGIQIKLGIQDRPHSLGHVEIFIPPPGEEDAPGSATYAELGSHGISFHCTVTLPADRAELGIEVRAFNRTFSPQPYDGGLGFAWKGSCAKIPDGFVLYAPDRDAGLALFPGDVPLDYASFMEDLFSLHRFPPAGDRTLAPRQLDVWSVRLVPVSGLQGLSMASAEAAISVDEQGCRIQSVSPRAAHKLLLLTEDGQTLEAVTNLYPEAVSEMNFSGLPSTPVALVLQSPAKEELLRFESRAPEQPFERWEASLPADASDHLRSLPTPRISPSTSTEALIRATFEPAGRSLAFTLLGMRALSNMDFSKASIYFEQSLLFNAEDHLTWWLKALAHRMGGDQGDERNELLNAHFLAPLEPALRAEGFLSLPDTHGKEPNPLLASLEDNPESFVEVACLLIECGLFDQATKWIDEAVRHVDLSMLRYLLAYSYLSASRMKVEAAEQVAAAARIPEGAPYPWRPIEVTALRTLAEAFPTDLRIKSLLGLIQAFRPM